MDDLGLTTTQYNTCVAVLFAGYVSLQVFSNIFASKINYPGICKSLISLLVHKPKLTSSDICFMCAVWGVISGCTGAVQSYAGLAVCRVVLGFAESAFFPGAVYLNSCFYTKKQMALRTAILYSGSQIGNAFGGLFALAILNLNGVHGLKGWRWLFIVEGKQKMAVCIECKRSLIGNRRVDCWLCHYLRNVHPQQARNHEMAFSARKGPPCLSIRS